MYALGLQLTPRNQLRAKPPAVPLSSHSRAAQLNAWPVQRGKMAPSPGDRNSRQEHLISISSALHVAVSHSTHKSYRVCTSSASKAQEQRTSTLRCAGHDSVLHTNSASLIQAVASAQTSTVPAARREFLSRRQLVGSAGLLTAGVAGAASAEDERRGERVVHTDAEWRAMLSPEQYKVLRQAGTELPTTSPLNNEKRRGTFVCAGCGAPLFSSAAKYNSGTGWPSFYEPLPGAVAETLDVSIFFYPRTEVRCKSCSGHLGHVFDDGPEPTGLRYCMNGAAMLFKPAEDAVPQA